MSGLEEYHQVIIRIKNIIQFVYGPFYLDYEEENYFRCLPRWKLAILGVLNFNFFINWASMIGSAFFQLDDKLLLLSLIMYSLLYFGAFYALYILFRYRPLFSQGAKDCWEFHSIRNVTTDLYCSKIIKKTALDSLLLMNVLSGLGVLAFVSTVILGTTMSYVIDKSDYPLPLPMFIFGIKPNGVLLYSFNLISNSLAVANGICSYLGAACGGLLNAVYALSRLGSIIKLTKEVKIISVDNSFKEYCRLVMHHMTIIRETLGKFGDAASGFFLFMQFQSYITLFTCWLIINVEISAFVRIFPGLIILSALGVCVLFNEAFIDKFDEMAYSFYDAEWYTMPVQDQKAFVLFISMAQNKVTLNAGGLNVLTLDWYSDLFKQGYNMALYMGDMVA